MSEKLGAAIIGPGNIGTDLLMKLQRSKWLEPRWIIGVDPQSEGLARAARAGFKTSAQGVAPVVSELKADGIVIAFDATSAYAHRDNAELMKGIGAYMVDLTPAAIGPFCVPPVNLDERLSTIPENLNMVTCGGQATIPMVAAVASVQSVSYAEIIAAVSSKSVGPGTRRNIDEFTQTTARALEVVGGARRGKAIIIVNPAEPPMLMRDTVHVITETAPDKIAIRDAVEKMAAEVRTYVPGYKLVNGPVFDGNRVSIFLEVEGLGDYLPRYSGNLDIMTAAAVRVGEMIAQRLRQGVRDVVEH